MCWLEGHNSRVLGTLPPRAIFMFLWIRLSVIHEKHFLSSLFSKFYIKILACFHEPQLGRIYLIISLSDSIFGLTNYKQKSWIWAAELFGFVNDCRFWMVWHFWHVALVLFNKSVYFHHSNKRVWWEYETCWQHFCSLRKLKVCFESRRKSVGIWRIFITKQVKKPWLCNFQSLIHNPHRFCSSCQQ